MIDLSGYTLRKLREDDEIVVYLGSASDQMPQIILVEPKPHASMLELVEKELSIAGVLNPEWAAVPIGLCDYNGKKALVLEDTGARSLYIQPGRPLDLGYFFDAAIGLASALGSAHAAGMIHRDVRPANTLIDDERRVRLTGFGRALRTMKDREVARPEHIVGTFAYMSPEQTGRTNWPIDERSDLYSLGITLYEMATGVLPFTESDRIGLIHCHLARQPKAPDAVAPAVSAQVSAVILKLLSKGPEDRYRTAIGLERDLRRLRRASEGYEVLDGFVPGENDISDRIAVPTKMLQRGLESDVLLGVFEQVKATGVSRIALVSGDPGSGKSFLLAEFQKRLPTSSCLFISGKFDQYSGDIPYATMTQAFSNLICQIAEGGAAELADWQRILKNALGSFGQLIANLIPQVGILLGDLPQVSDSSPLEMQTRFQQVFKRFVGAFARPDCPLVLFLDDLQWSDHATLGLIEALATDPDLTNLLLIGAYRDSKAKSDSALFTTLQRIQAKRQSPVELVLRPLHRQEVAQLIGQMIGSGPTSLGPLADFVFDKTDGNPFFTVQFIISLADQGLLKFDLREGRWTWDLERIQEQPLSENIAILLSERLRRLPDDTKAALSVMACIGSTSTIDEIANIAGRSAENCEAVISSALAAGVLRKGAGTYTFVHDRVQEAAYALVLDVDRPAIHLRIGRAFQNQNMGEYTRSIFETADQINRGMPLVLKADDRIALAELNLSAALQAKAGTAYASALAYTLTGLSLLPATKWDSDYTLTCGLLFLRLECELFTANHPVVESLIEEIRPHRRTPSDYAKLCCMEVDWQVLRSDHARGVAVVLDCLTSLGFDLPAEPSSDEVETFFDALCLRIEGQDIEALVELPLASDPAILAAIRVLQALFAPAGFHNAKLLQLNLFHMVDLTLRHGVTEASPAGLAWFGVILGHVYGRYAEGAKFANLAYALVERHGFVADKAKTLLALEVATNWTTPIAETLLTVRAGLAAALVSGDMTTACYCGPHIVALLLIQGDTLESVLQETNQALASSAKAKFRDVYDIAIGQRRFVRTMQGETVDFSSFDGDDFNSADFEATLTPDRMTMLMCKHWIMQGSAWFMSGDYAKAEAEFERARPLIPATSGHLQRVWFEYFSALTSAALVGHDCESPDFERHRGRIDAHRRQLKTWAETCPTTFANKHVLISAELARIDGRDLEAMKFYDTAIELARENGAIHNEAIGLELAARFYVGRGFQMIADTYLQNARRCYVHWGAHGKVRQLDRLFPHIHIETAPSIPSSIGLKFTDFDLDSVLKISQEVSSEIELDRLIEKLMVSVVEHAGASRGILLLPHDGELHIAAEAMIGDDGVKVTLRTAKEVRHLPEAVLSHAVQYKEAVILNDATVDNDYGHDAYIGTAQPRSVLCLPLMRQQQLVGVLYLENNLLPDIFNTARLLMLQVLASQAAISIENARLFKDVVRAQERERQTALELRQTFDTIPAIAWIASKDGYIEYANRRWYEFTGISKQDLLADVWSSAFHPDDAGNVIDYWQKIIVTGSPGEIEARMRRSDGAFRSFLVRATPLRDEAGKIVRWYGTNIDIDHLKRAEEAQEALARAARVTAMGELTISIAHEVNQPLMAIVTNAATCLRWLSVERLNVEEARRAAERVVRDGHRAGDVLASIRALARKSSPKVIEVDLNLIVSEVLLLVRGELQRHSIATTTQLLDAVEPVLGDPVQLQQVILNLVINAIEAMQENKDGARLLSITTYLNQDSKFQVRVADTGLGVDPDLTERIFDAFFTTKPEGLGIGLSICRSIIEGSGGRLWATDNPGGGCVLNLILPVVELRNLPATD